MATVHLTKDGDTGHLLRLPVSKHLATKVGCQYCETCLSPASMDVVFSGVAAAYWCFKTSWPDTSGNWVTAPSVFPDGSFTLTVTANPCVWSYTTSVTLALDFWTESDSCPGFPDEQHTLGAYTFWISLTVGADNRTLYAGHTVPRGFYETLYIPAFRLVETPTLCGDGGGDNEYVGATDLAGHYGGSVTIAVGT
jgi:hypothetical protein